MERSWIRKPLAFARLAALLAALLVAAPVGAQRPAESGAAPGLDDTAPGARNDAAPAEPCCTITTIDAGTGLVTARHGDHNASFRFRVTDRMLLRSLTVGQEVHADFEALEVGIGPMSSCCEIAPPPPPPEIEARCEREARTRRGDGPTCVPRPSFMADGGEGEPWSWSCACSSEPQS